MAIELTSPELIVAASVTTEQITVEQSTVEQSTVAESSPSLLQSLSAGQLGSQDLTNLLVRYRMMPQLYQEVVLDEAIAAIECPAAAAQEAQKVFYAAQGITTEEGRQIWLKAQNLSEEHAAWLAIRVWRLEQFKQATWGKQVGAHFMSCKSQLDQVVYSVLRVEQFATAQELFFRIKAGEQDFAAAARAYSQGAEAVTGGLIGPMPMSQPHPLVASKLQAATIGQILPPFQLENWAILLRLEQVIPAKLDEPTQKKLLDNMFQTWLKATVGQLLSQGNP